jgi:glycosyltransferase involved in cell wall biosynthesis
MCLVSIIVPNFNHATFLEKRLKSIFDQDFLDFELIILDDASIDNSDVVIKTLIQDKLNITYIKNTINSGSTFRQWNKGISIAKGKYIWIAESDDYSENNFLSTLTPYLEENFNVSLVYCQSNLVSERSITSNILNWTDDLSKDLWLNDFFLQGKDAVVKYWIHKNILINASSAVFRKDVYLKYATGNYNFKLCGDWYSWINLMREHNLVFCSKSLNYYRRHENTVTHNFGEKLFIKKEIHNIHLLCLKHFCSHKKDFILL